MNKALKLKLNKTITKAYYWIIHNQTKEGTWPVSYDGPFFLLPLYIFAARICGKEITTEQKHKMSNYILHHQIDDGSFGLHQESKWGTVFCSCINYVALRMLGHSPEKEELKKCLTWIHQQGGPLYSNSWCKFILAFLNLYSYKGVSPIPPELYLMPAWFPFHPRKISGYVRVIYLPMCYFYRKQFSVETEDLILKLREELYEQEYDKIDFKKYRGVYAECDNIFPETKIFKFSIFVIQWFEKWIPSFVKRKALELVYNHIRYEDEHSKFIRQAPVNAVYNTLVYHFLGKKELVEQSWKRLPEYLWESEDEILMQGFTNTRVWDTSFFLQVIGSDSNKKELKSTAQRSINFLIKNQINTRLPEPFKYLRVDNYGGWPFSIRDNGWAVADCTAEAIKGLLETNDEQWIKMHQNVLKNGLNFILSIQNQDGGWASVDQAIGDKRLEWFNASNVFLDIMVDHSYVECTASVLQTFVLVKQKVPELFDDVLEKSFSRALKYLLSQQKEDGSWEATWGICFTYGTFFAIEALRAVGFESDHPIIQKGCKFLLLHQRENGAWGEAQETCIERKYIQADKGCVEQTAWAVMALVQGGYVSDKRIAKAIEWLMDQQMEDGDWPIQPITGLFYKTTMIAYRNYRRYFTLMALKKYQKYLTKEESKMVKDRKNLLA